MTCRIRLWSLNHSNVTTERGVRLEVGDALGGDTSCAAAAMALAQALIQPAARNGTLSLEGGGADAAALPRQDEWDDLFLKLDGPELMRMPLAGAFADDAALARTWLREWADSGAATSDLTTPVVLEQPSAGVRFVFEPLGRRRSAAFADKDDNKDDGIGLRSGRATRRKLEGGLELVVDADPNSGRARLRAKRCLYKPKAVVKLMSETTILSRLKRDLASASR